MEIEIIVDCFARAASTERKLLDRTRRMLWVKSGMPDYIYDADDRKDQEPERMRVRPSGKDIDNYEMCLSWLRFLGMRQDNRTVRGKKIIWARAYGYSYKQIGVAFGMSSKTVENWYKADIVVIGREIL